MKRLLVTLGLLVSVASTTKAEIADALYRDGVFFVEWHAALYYHYDAEARTPFVIHSIGPFGVVKSVRVTDWNWFIGTDKFTAQKCMGNPSRGVRQVILDTAYDQLNAGYWDYFEWKKPNKTPGDGTGRFRCDGLVQYSYEQAGLLPVVEEFFEITPRIQAMCMDDAIQTLPELDVTVPSSISEGNPTLLTGASNVVTFRATARDEHSGVSGVVFYLDAKLDGTNWYLSPTPRYASRFNQSFSLDIALQPNVLYRVRASVVDSGGNWMTIAGYRYVKFVTAVGDQPLAAQVEMPVISPVSGTYVAPMAVEITCATADVDIRYTLDGTEPTESSDLYLAPFDIGEQGTSITLMAKGFHDTHEPSFVASAEYTFSRTTYHLEVVNGSGSGDYAPGTPVVIVADEPPAGAAFREWRESTDCIADGSLATTTVIMPAEDAIVRASYVEEAVPYLLVTSPNGGETWLRNSDQTITWTSFGVTGNVKIELYDDTVLAATIAASTENSGTYGYAVPGTLPLGFDYRVRVASIDAPAVFDLSNGCVTVADETHPTLTLQTSSETGGGTSPDTGQHVVDVDRPLDIEAMPGDGHVFVRWLATGNAFLADPHAIYTAVTLSGDATVTALFALDDEACDFQKVVVKRSHTAADNGKITVKGGQIPAAVVPADIDVDAFNAGTLAFRVLVDAYALELSNANGTLSQKGDKDIYTFKSNPGAPKVSLIISLMAGKRFWSLAAKGLDLRQGIDSVDGVDLYLDLGGKAFGRTLEMAETVQWKYEAGKDAATPLSVAGGIPMTTFGIGKFTARAVCNKENKDKLDMVGTMDFVGLADYDPTTQRGFMILDGWALILEDGVRKGDQIIYESLPDAEAKCTLVIEVVKKTWRLKLSQAEGLADGIDAADGIDVVIELEEHEGGLNLGVRETATLQYSQPR
jgi:hypothetical protein